MFYHLQHLRCVLSIVFQKARHELLHRGMADLALGGNPVVVLLRRERSSSLGTSATERLHQQLAIDLKPWLGCFGTDRHCPFRLEFNFFSRTAACSDI